jgi:hypothetical protein
MARFGIAKNEDNTGRVLTYNYLKPAYVATLSVNLSNSKTFVEPALLTGAMTVNAVVSNSLEFDEVVFLLTADSTNRVVTFGTNFKTSGTLTVTASKIASIAFVFNGTYWVEVSRTVTA